MSGKLCEHYGRSLEEQDKKIRLILSKMVGYDTLVQVVDESFPELNAEQRADVTAFADALVAFKILMQV